MKKVVIIFVLVFAFTAAFSQAPQKFSYQGVVRNTAGTLIQNGSIAMKISILQGSAAGPIVYEETHTTTTNTNGLVTLEIGAGSILTGTLSAINWSAGPYYIKTSTDPTGGTNYTVIGTSQLLSVPYALYSQNSNASAQGVVGVKGWAGLVNTIYGGSSFYVFAGPTVTVAITSASQKLVASASAPLALPAIATSTVQQTEIGICYQLQGVVSPIYNFTGLSFSIYEITKTRSCYSVSATVSGLPPGIYKIGLGIKNNGATNITNNDYVNGWVMLVN